MKVLGVSASLRNIRRGKGSEKLVQEINQINNQEHLIEYLKSQAQLGLSAFIEAGRKEGKSFDTIYRNLRKLSGAFGMSNSEIMLSAGLWGARSGGMEIEHVSLSDYFGTKRGNSNKSDALLEKVENADGILLSGPVYFGDRSSLAHDFLQTLQKEHQLVDKKVFAGIAVGAKRNGGQETCLIYQMIDFISLGMLGVGNDDQTTAQYGGTGHAGDIGAASEDHYGIRTSIGTGNRIAQALKLIRLSKGVRLKDKPRIGIIILQDADSRAKRFIESHILKSDISSMAEFKYYYFVNESVKRCIACDMCPQAIGNDEDYRCIIKDPDDLFSKYHSELINLDALLIGGYSPQSHVNIKSVYQSFMERTRYIRRADYIFSNLLVAPFVIQEIGSRENLQTRIHTSIIRHHTIVHKPILFHCLDKDYVNLDESLRTLKDFVRMAHKILAGRILYYSNFESYSNYTPFGYTLSSERDRIPRTIEKRKENMDNRRNKIHQMFKNRIL